MTTTAAKRNGRKASREPYSWDADRFFEAMEESGTVTEGCRAVGIVPSTAYRRRDSDPEFGERWSAISEAATERLEKVAYRRAEQGSDRLLEFLLKARRPDVYRERISIDDDRAEQERRRLERASESELDERLVGVADNVIPIRRAT